MVVKQKTLINKEYLVEYSLLPKNYNIDEVWNYIPIAELLHIVPLIGMDLYDELLELVEANKVTPANATLLLLIYPYECMALVDVAMPYLAYRVNEAGITKNSSENSLPLNLNELNYIADQVRSLMNVVKLKLVDFLNKNKDLYPKLKQESGQAQESWNIYGFGQINTDVDNNKMKLV